LNPAPPGAFHQPHRDYHARWGLVSRFFESTLMKTIDPIFLSYPVPKAANLKFGLGAQANICSTM
jgi:hypothetical protein